MPIINSIAALHPAMTAWRRDLHAHPELSMREARTSGLVRAKLEEFGVDEIITGMATHGVVGVIRAGSSERAIGLRADMDALPIHEETGLAHASRKPWRDACLRTRWPYNHAAWGGKVPLGDAQLRRHGVSDFPAGGGIRGRRQHDGEGRFV